ncbi:MAG: hypothetical protein Fur006_67210 [Coleofasciculaceae cyanobacterium]
MLELVEDEAQAIRVVKLALEVDLRLGARLAGEVKSKWQEQTVGLVAELEVSQLLKIELLSLTKSKQAIPELVKALNDEDSDVRRSAADALGKIGSEAAIRALVAALKDENSDVRWSAVSTLGNIGSETAILELVKALQHENSDVRLNAATELLGIDNTVAVNASNMYFENREIDSSLSDEEDAHLEATHQEINQAQLDVFWDFAYTSEIEGDDAAVDSLIKALQSQDLYIRYAALAKLGTINNEKAVNTIIIALQDEISSIRIQAVYALSKNGSDTAVPQLITALNDEVSEVRSSAAYALGKIASPELLPSLFEHLKTEKETNLLYTIAAIQERCKFYNYTLTQPPSPPVPRKSKPKKTSTQPKSLSLMHILHLSDLHITTLDQTNLWSNQLAADLYNDLSIPHLDALILSGDIANYSTEEEYIAAQQFLHNLRQDFPLNPEQIILVPGNHDLNWKLAKKAYKLIDRDDYDGQLIDGHYIEESASVIRVRDEAEYKQRFTHFSQFYEAIKQNPYPLDYDQQYTLDHLKEQNLLILGLNSAWELDHHYKSRASINTNALSNALTQIRRNPDYRNCLKIAVWHHPLDSAHSDRITDQGFLEQLAVNGFRFFLHGHIHKAETSLFRYDMSTNGRKLDRICAGTFGAPTKELVTGTPWQYNLLKIEDNQLTVYTRRREELNGAWKPDARWLQGKGKGSADFYRITL